MILERFGKKSPFVFRDSIFPQLKIFDRPGRPDELGSAWNELPVRVPAQEDRTVADRKWNSVSLVSGFGLVLLSAADPAKESCDRVDFFSAFSRQNSPESEITKIVRLNSQGPRPYTKVVGVTL